MGSAMESAETLAGYKDLLPLGTQVGPWRVEAWAGGGVHGAVYRAVRVGDEQAGPVALKLALLPRDPRFAREAHLLSRLNHPNIPRLWEHGTWQHPTGTLHPYLAMEWVEGLPLYAWAQAHPPSSQQVLQVLAQLARALMAVHPLGAVHRDVKGANVLMRLSDGRAFLTDFGTGIYPGAATLTPPRTPVGTPAYLSPEAWLYELRALHDPAARYVCGPADDLYALGVTACRLLTGGYPDFSEPYKDANGVWQVDAVIPPAALLTEGLVEPELRARVLRLLSPRPEQRGSVVELVEALEQAPPPSALKRAASRLGSTGAAASGTASHEDLAAARPSRLPEVCDAEPQEPKGAGVGLKASAGTGGSVERLKGRPRSRRLWLAATAGFLALALGAWWAAAGAPLAQRQGARRAAGEEAAGPVGLGDDAASSTGIDAPGSSGQEMLAEEPLPEPFPGQTRPDAKGRCPHKRQVAINGGCWVELEREKCEALNLDGRIIKDTCYVPITPLERPSTSRPPHPP